MKVTDNLLSKKITNNINHDMKILLAIIFNLTLLSVAIFSQQGWYEQQSYISNNCVYYIPSS